MEWWFIGVTIFVVLVAYCGFPVMWTRMFRLSSRHLTRLDGRVALTFDDGPHPVYTPKLLDVLRQVGATATFFVIVHKALEYPEIVERMIAEGHEVQVHGYRHHFVPFLHPWATARQCIGAQRALSTRFKVRSMVYRPPWGACNIVTLWLLRRHGITMCLWSVMVGDWRRTEPEVLVRRIGAKLTNQGIIVLHDSDETYGAQTESPCNVITAIPSIVALVRQRGYEFVRISECI